VRSAYELHIDGISDFPPARSYEWAGVMFGAAAARDDSADAVWVDVEVGETLGSRWLGVVEEEEQKGDEVRWLRSRVTSGGRGFAGR
jgi:hypothetical protein